MKYFPIQNQALLLTSHPDGGKDQTGFGET